MCGLLALTAVFLPVLELYVIIEIGARIGAGQAILLIFVTAGLGLWAARGQSLRALDRVRRGQVPARAEVLEGPLLLGSALALLLPGFVTDTLGALLLIPPLRRALARRLVRRYGRPGPDGEGEIIIITRRVE